MTIKLKVNLDDISEYNVGLILEVKSVNRQTGEITVETDDTKFLRPGVQHWTKVWATLVKEQG